MIIEKAIETYLIILYNHSLDSYVALYNVKIKSYDFILINCMCLNSGDYNQKYLYIWDK